MQEEKLRKDADSCLKMISVTPTPTSPAEPSCASKLVVVDNSGTTVISDIKNARRKGKKSCRQLSEDDQRYS
jgi:hypothetical protein